MQNMIQSGMPDMNGLKLAAQIRTIRPETKIILLTG